MKKWLKRTILIVVVGYLVLVAVNQSIPLIIGKGNCQKPLHVVAKIQLPTTYTPVLTQSDFQKEVERAITEWETRTGMDLFEVIDPNSTLAKSGLANTITAMPRDLTKLDLGQESLKAGWTDARTMGDRVENFKVEIYNTSPAVMYQVILHELGHARGLWGHSENPEDVMYGEASYVIKSLSQADVDTMVNYCQAN